ncbi:squalene--hopene cyclase [Paenisporosarcina sp. TG-14]|uniref:squalene--hopene cyclase n=1 Tax=Paenisporosarcina sp. TG-14 TaxID=1231057 RepID=UPI0003137ECE|nr:squalene--hopene cyclase [Paenisporosarcina sp. TG-14]
MSNTPSDEIKRIVSILKKDQSEVGTWNYPFETGITTDAYMIILLRSLTIDDEEELIKELVDRILSKQEDSGAWKLFYDEDGNVSATIEAYYALLYSGYCSDKEVRMQAARQFILSNGGIDKSSSLTKIMLAVTGQIPWSKMFTMPIEFVLLPLSFPLNFFDFSVFGRANLAPLMILTDKKYTIKTNKSPNISDLYMSKHTQWDEEYVTRILLKEWSPFLSSIQRKVEDLIGLPKQIQELAVDKTKQYMLERIEPDGTLYSYFSSTFLLIFSLLSLGYKKDDPAVIHAINGLKSMKCQVDGKTHMQFTTPTIWNTALISYAMQEAGVSELDPVIKKANRFLLTRQHYKFGDWVIHSPQSLPGGWGFSNINTMNPDIDDTTASLRAICKTVNINTNVHTSWDRGIKWVFSMQNDDGGWPSFEKGVNKSILSMIPIEDAEYLLADPSSADLTGRTLEFFGNFTNLKKSHDSIKLGVNWLLDHQEPNGSWYGRWGICYIYGSWAAITGLVAAGLSQDHPSILKSLKWLRDIQNPDGGWGESCKSDKMKTYVPLGSSTLTHTAWALDALIAAEEKVTPEIVRGINYILENNDKVDWTTAYPKGQGMAGSFYIHYHSYRYIFPLLALAHYQKKFTNDIHT